MPAWAAAAGDLGAFVGVRGAQFKERVRLLDQLRPVTELPPQSMCARSNIRIRLLWHKRPGCRHGGWIAISSPRALPPVLASGGDCGSDDSEHDGDSGNAAAAEMSSGVHGHADIAECYTPGTHASVKHVLLGETTMDSHLARRATSTLQDSGSLLAARGEPPLLATAGAASPASAALEWTGESARSAAARAAEATARARGAMLLDVVKPIEQCHPTGEVNLSGIAAARALSINQGSIAQAAYGTSASGTIHTMGSDGWLFADDGAGRDAARQQEHARLLAQATAPVRAPPPTNKRSSRAVQQLDFHTHAVIGRFESAKGAARALAEEGSERTEGTLVVYIREALKGRRAEAGGYRWRYAPQYAEPAYIADQDGAARLVAHQYRTRDELRDACAVRNPEIVRACLEMARHAGVPDTDGTVIIARALVAELEHEAAHGDAPAVTDAPPPAVGEAPSIPITLAAPVPNGRHVAAVRPHSMALPDGIAWPRRFGVTYPTGKPRGRPPKGKRWCASSRQWVPEASALVRNATRTAIVGVGDHGDYELGVGDDCVHGAAAASLRALAVSLATTSRALQYDGQSLLADLPSSRTVRNEGGREVRRLADQPALAATIAASADATRFAAAGAARANATRLVDEPVPAATVTATAKITMTPPPGRLEIDLSDARGIGGDVAVDKLAEESPVVGQVHRGDTLEAEDVGKRLCVQKSGLRELVITRALERDWHVALEPATVAAQGVVARDAAACNATNLMTTTLDARANLDDMPALAPNIAAQDLQLGLGFATRLAAATTTPTNATHLVERPALAATTAPPADPRRLAGMPFVAANAAALALAGEPALAMAATALTEVDLQLSGHAQPLDEAKARRQYRKELIQKQRLATKTHNHTHYESRRQAANNRTRIGGRFQKKNHDEYKAADERTLGPEGARCKRKATNGQTLVLDEDRDERKAAKAPRVTPTLPPQTILPAPSRESCPLDLARAADEPGKTSSPAPGLLFHSSNGIPQPPAPSPTRLPALGLATLPSNAVPALQDQGLRSSPELFHVAVPAEPPPCDATLEPGWAIAGTV